MIIPAALLCLLAVVGETTAHPGHSDLLSKRDAEALYKRQELVARCSHALRARHAPRMARLEARRAAIIGRKEQPDLVPCGMAKPEGTASTSIQSLEETTVSAVSTSDLATSATATTSASLLISALAFNGTLPAGVNGTGPGGNGTGGVPGNGTGGMAGGGGGSTSYIATATAASTYATLFPSSASTASLASATTQAVDSACALSPEEEEGPYYIQGESIRSNLIETETGIPFYAEFALIDINTCGALVNAAVDIWSCNSTGEYGGFVSSDSTTYDTSLYSGEIAHVGDSNDAGSVITDTKTALRGQQLTNEDGIAQFTTLLPGWYAGRTAHIHIRVHVGGEVTANGTYIGGNLTHTGQTFFGEDLYTNMQGIYPYTQSSVVRTTNENDHVWTQQNGSYSAWNLFYVVPGDITQGVIGYLNLAVDSTAST